MRRQAPCGAATLCPARQRLLGLSRCHHTRTTLSCTTHHRPPRRLVHPSRLPLDPAELLAEVREARRAHQANRVVAAKAVVISPRRPFRHQSRAGDGGRTDPTPAFQPSRPIPEAPRLFTKRAAVRLLEHLGEPFLFAGSESGRETAPKARPVAVLRSRRRGDERPIRARRLPCPLACGRGAAAEPSRAGEVR